MSSAIKAPSKKKTSKKVTGCTPISISVAILTPDDENEIHFGLTKGCNPDDSVFWIIDFLLKQKNSAGLMVTRVEVHVHVGEDEKATAEAVSKAKKLSPEGLDLLETDVVDQAKKDPDAPEMKEVLVDALRAGAPA